MTTCSTFANSIKKRVEAGTNLKDIAAEMCGEVKFNRRKVIRVIKDFLGEEYLLEHAATLGYSTEKAALARKKIPQQIIDATTECDSTPFKPKEKELPDASQQKFDATPDTDLIPPRQELEEELARAITELVQKYGFQAVAAVVQAINIPTNAENTEKTASIDPI